MSDYMSKLRKKEDVRRKKNSKIAKKIADAFSDDLYKKIYEVLQNGKN